MVRFIQEETELRVTQEDKASSLRAYLSEIPGSFSTSKVRRQTTSFTCIFWKAGRPEKLKLYGKLSFFKLF